MIGYRPAIFLKKSLLFTKYVYYLKYLFSMWIYLRLIYCDFKASFSASLLQSRNPSEIILIAAQKNFVIILMMKTAEYIYFSGFFDE